MRRRKSRDRGKNRETVETGTEERADERGGRISERTGIRQRKRGTTERGTEGKNLEEEKQEKKEEDKEGAADTKRDGRT